MNATINFLKNRQRALTTTQKRDKRFFYIGLATLGVIFLLFLAALGTQLYFTFQVRTVQASTETFKQTIEAQESNERSFLVFNAKVKALADIFKGRSNKQEAIRYFSSLFGDDVLMSDISYDQTSGILSFTLQSANVFTLERVFTILKSEAVVTRFSQVSSSGLRRSTDGSYQMTVTVVLTEEAK
ncbi:MAG: hypothetical protein M3Q81_01700 [bacterium]|nr:hypothetical protein [bacterium]